MNLNHPNRKRFIGPALIVSATVAVISIVVISANLSRVDSQRAKDEARDKINAVRALKPAQLTGKMAPPAILEGRIMSAPTADDASTSPFFDEGANELTIEGFRGTGLVINFWATWCLPCIKEMPALDNLAGELNGSGTKGGIRVLALSVDRRALQKVPIFYKETKIKNLDIHFDEKGILSKKLGVKGLPTTVLIKADGSILGSVIGVLEWDNDVVREYLVRVLSAPPD